jgi:hypothetical protein
MDRPYETLDLRPTDPVTESMPRQSDFAAVRVGGDIDGYEVLGALAEGGMRSRPPCLAAAAAPSPTASSASSARPA